MGFLCQHCLQLVLVFWFCCHHYLCMGMEQVFTLYITYVPCYSSGKHFAEHYLALCNLTSDAHLIHQCSERRKIPFMQLIVQWLQILFIHSFLGHWANHDHLTSSLKHIINQTNI